MMDKMLVLVPVGDHEFRIGEVRKETVVFNVHTQTYTEYGGDDYLEEGDEKLSLLVVR